MDWPVMWVFCKAGWLIDLAVEPCHELVDLRDQFRDPLWVAAVEGHLQLRRHFGCGVRVERGLDTSGAGHVSSGIGP
mgnify:CR=1 FL=1